MNAWDYDVSFILFLSMNGLDTECVLNVASGLQSGARRFEDGERRTASSLQR